MALSGAIPFLSLYEGAHLELDGGLNPQAPFLDLNNYTPGLRMKPLNRGFVS